jgi:hypothetical protein
MLTPPISVENEAHIKAFTGLKPAIPADMDCPIQYFFSLFNFYQELFSMALNLAWFNSMENAPCLGRCSPAALTSFSILETFDALLFWRRSCPDVPVRIINPDRNVRVCVTAKSQAFCPDQGVRVINLKTQRVNGLYAYSKILPFYQQKQLYLICNGG